MPKDLELIEEVMADPDLCGCEDAALFLFSYLRFTNLKMVAKITPSISESFVATLPFLIRFYSETQLSDEEKREVYKSLLIKPGQYRLPESVSFGVRLIIASCKRKERLAGGRGSAEFVCDRPETKIKTEHLNIEPIWFPQEICDRPETKIKTERLNADPPVNVKL